VHTLGAGSDAATQWLRAFTLLPAVPIVYLLMRRMFPGTRPSARRAPARATTATHRPALAEEATS
jgi:hypothetical protein